MDENDKDVRAWRDVLFLELEAVNAELAAKGIPELTLVQFGKLERGLARALAAKFGAPAKP